MELGNRLSVDIYNEYANRIHNLGETLMFAGYELSEDAYLGSDWQGLLENVLVRGLSKKYYPHLIKDEIFNAQERILETIDFTVDWVNPYSQSGFVFLKNNGALYRYVKRWFDWLGYNEKIVGGEIQKHQHLYSLENGTNEQVFDIDEQPILTLEGYFSE